MTQAKGVLPRREDKDVLYKNPRTCGYFIAVRLAAEADRSAVEEWLHSVSGFVDELVQGFHPLRGLLWV